MYLISDLIKRIFYPDDFGCALCRRRGKKYDTHAGFVICDDCIKSFKKADGTVCIHCGRKLKSEDSLCGMCAKHDFKFEKCASVYEYAGSARNLMHKLKYASEQWLADYLGKALYEKYKGLGWDAQIVMYVPMHPQKEAKRGYNQAKLLAEAFAEKSCMLLSHALVRTKNTTPQSLLDKEERISNMQGAIAVKEEGKLEVAGKVILVIDDIQTTGTSINECAKALIDAGAAKVYGLCACSVSD